jgi:hypothetical protein
MKLASTFRIVAICLLPLFQCVAEAAPVEAPKLPEMITLRDQYDSPQELRFPATNITVITISDRKGSEEVEGWIALLKTRYQGGIDLRGIADVAGVPSFLQGRIRRKFQETRKYPVMMDWSGTVCALFKYKKETANLLVIGRDGTILGHFLGPADGPGGAAARAILDKALSDPHRGASNLKPH